MKAYREMKFSARATFVHDLMPCFNRFFHYLPTCHRQRPYAAAAQVPQAFVFVPNVKKNEAFACGCVIEGRTQIFGDQ